MGAKVVVELVRAGYAASIHARAYGKIYGVEVELRAVASSRQERAAAFAAQFGVPQATSSVAELLTDPAIDLVDICAPNPLHAELAIAATNRGKHVIVEKPLTGSFGDGADNVDTISRDVMLRAALTATDEMVAVARANGVRLLYAENWIYAPAIQKARQLMTAAAGTILRIQGEESHCGSHAAYAKRWQTAGGSLLGMGCHPLAAALYLKRAEGIARDGRPIRPRTVVAEVDRLTRNPTFVSEQPKFIQDGWHDVEDWGAMLVPFEDRSVAQITASDAALGGIRNCLTVYRSRAVAEANLNPYTACVTYAPSPEMFASEYISEKIDTKAVGASRRPTKSTPRAIRRRCRILSRRWRTTVSRSPMRRRSRQLSGLPLGSGRTTRRPRRRAGHMIGRGLESMKFAVFTVSLPEWTPEEAVRNLAELEYDGVEWRIADDPPRPTPGFWGGNRCTFPLRSFIEDAPRIQALSEGAGLAILAVASYVQAADLENVERVMRGTAALGAPAVRIQVPRYDGQVSSVALWD
jgi:predicted dehydrogenase